MPLRLTPRSWALAVGVAVTFGLVYALTSNGWAAFAFLVAGLAAVTLVVTRPERERVAGLVERAVERGWSHEPTAADPAVSRLAPLDHPGEARDVVRGSWLGRPFVAYERTHRTRTDADDPETERRHDLAVVAVTARTPALVLDPPPRRWSPPAPGRAAPTVFDVRWQVVDGRAALTGAVRRRLLAPDARGLHLRCTGEHVVAVRERPFDADGLEAVLDLLGDLASMLAPGGDPAAR